MFDMLIKEPSLICSLILIEKQIKWKTSMKIYLSFNTAGYRDLKNFFVINTYYKGSLIIIASSNSLILTNLENYRNIASLTAHLIT